MERPQICKQCGKQFRDRYHLERHQNRLIPCVVPQHICMCGRKFVSNSGLLRHKKMCCVKGPKAKNGTQTQIAAPAMSKCANCVQTITQNIQIIPFTEEPIVIGWNEIRAVFGGLPDLEKIAIDDAVPRVVNALMEVVRVKHRDQRERNIRLNPARTDFVRVLMPTERGTQWVLRPLVEAVAILFARIAQGWRATGDDTNPAHRPEELKKQAHFAGGLVAGAPADYAQRGKGPFTALLYNEAAGCLPTPADRNRRPAQIEWPTAWPPPDCPTPFAACPITISWEVAAGVLRETPAGSDVCRAVRDTTGQAPALLAGFVAELAEQAMAPRTEQRAMLNHDLGFVSVMEDHGWGMMRLDRAFEAICRKMGHDLSALQPAEGRDAAALALLHAAGAVLEDCAATCAATAREGLIDVLGRILDGTPPARRAELHLP